MTGKREGVVEAERRRPEGAAAVGRREEARAKRDRHEERQGWIRFKGETE